MLETSQLILMWSRMRTLALRSPGARKQAPHSCIHFTVQIVGLFVFPSFSRPCSPSDCSPTVKEHSFPFFFVHRQAFKKWARPHTYIVLHCASIT